MKTITQLLLEYDTDKERYHHYGEFYDEHLTKYRIFNNTKLLEIGIEKGESLLVWNQFFNGEHVQIHGIDITFEHINLDELESHTMKIQVHQGDATNYDFIREIVREDIPDRLNIIIDDGSHRIGDQITSLILWWEHLAYGGIYIIEDIPVWNTPMFQAIKGMKIVNTGVHQDDYIAYMVKE